MSLDPDFARNNRYITRTFDPRQTALGVEQELRHFATNEYNETKNQSSLIGTDPNVPDDEPLEDDLLLTNAVTEDTVQDKIDKERYLKEVKSYITINSGARQTTSTLPNVPPINENDDIKQKEINLFPNSLYSSNGSYRQMMAFAPFKTTLHDDEYVVVISSANNHIRFALQDWTDSTDVVQVKTPKGKIWFDAYLPITGTYYTLTELQSALETYVNAVASQGIPLDNSSDKNHMFAFNVTYNVTINPDRVTVYITCQTNYKYAWDFLVVTHASIQAIAEPIPASDAALVVQDPSVATDASFQFIYPTIYPYPNSYALDLDRAYKNVKSVRVVWSSIPNTSTVINLRNHHVSFRLIDKTLPPPTDDDPYTQNIRTSEGLLDWDVYLTYGNYTVQELASHMEFMVNNLLFGEVGLKNVFHVSVNTNTGVFEIHTTDPYTFMWDFNANDNLQWFNLYYMLGYETSAMTFYSNIFDNQIAINVGPDDQVRFIRVPFRAIMLRKSLVVWLQLNNYETIYDTMTKNYYFCSFSMGKTKQGEYAINTFTPNVQVFVDAPIPTLSRIDVRMYDEVGMPYNFNGVNHSFTLEITHHVDRLMGNDYSSRRGVTDKSSYV
jgi:hypothetical protein